MRTGRGRPDLVHQAVLAAVATPLYRDGLVRMYVHTIRDVVVRFGEGVRVPKSYHRFEGLFAKLLREGRAGGGGRRCWRRPRARYHPCCRR